jgi:tetratricopeptide (TPR) repeat protein
MAKRAVQLGGYSPDAYMNLALSYWEAGRNREAEKILQQGLANVQPFFEAELLLGEIYLAEAKFDSATERFERIIHSPSSSKDVTYDLEILSSKGDPHRQEGSHIKAKAHFNLATVYMQRGELSLAEAHIRQALSLKPDFAEAHANLGTLLDHTGRGVEALRLLEEATSRDPQNAVYHYNLGLAYAKRLDLEAAREEFQNALTLDPSLTDAEEKLQLVDSLLQSRGVSP